jgi:DNA-binding NtrC family response regulator
MAPHSLTAGSDAPMSKRPQSSLPPAELLDPSLDRRVLVIAQDQVLARALGRALRRANCDTIWEGDWHKALDLFDDAQLGLGAVLLDLDVAGIDHMQACAAIQARRPDLPVVLLTNASDTGASASSLRAEGQYVWVRKPVDPVVLARVVATAVRRRFARS